MPRRRLLSLGEPEIRFFEFYGQPRERRSIAPPRHTCKFCFGFLSSVNSNNYSLD